MTVDAGRGPVPAALSGVPTFFNAPVADLEDVGPGDVAVVGIYCDHYGEGEPGARFLPRQFRYACALDRRSPPGGVFDLGDLSVFPLEPQRCLDALSDQARRLARTGAHMLAIGGDYGLTPALLAGLRAARPSGTLGVLRISGSPDLGPCGASVLSRSAASTRIRALDGGIRVAFAGLSGPVPEVEAGALAETVFVSARSCLDETLAAIAPLRAWADSCDGIYLSVDADVLSPACVRTARARRQGGLSQGDVLRLLDALGPLRAVGAEFTGLVPDLDVAGRGRSAMCLDPVEALLSGMIAGRDSCR